MGMGSSPTGSGSSTTGMANLPMGSEPSTMGMGSSPIGSGSSTTGMANLPMGSALGGKVAPAGARTAPRRGDAAPLGETPGGGARHAFLVLPVDEGIAGRWGRYNSPDPLPVLDSLLAATAGHACPKPGRPSPVPGRRRPNRGRRIRSWGKPRPILGSHRPVWGSRPPISGRRRPIWGRRRPSRGSGSPRRKSIPASRPDDRPSGCRAWSRS